MLRSGGFVGPIGRNGSSLVSTMGSPSRCRAVAAVTRAHVKVNRVAGKNVRVCASTARKNQDLVSSFRHAALAIPPRQSLTVHKAPPSALHRFAIWPALISKAMKRLQRLPASGAHNLLLHIARSRGPRGPSPVTAAPLCRAILMKLVWHERDDPHWLRTAAGVCGLAVSRSGVDWNAHVPVRYRAAVLADITRGVESVAEAIGPTTDGASIGYVCEAARTLGLESKQFTNVVMDAVADISDEGRRFGPLPLVQVVAFLADYAACDPSRKLPDGLDKILEWRLSCHWPEVSGQNLAQLLVSLEGLGWLSEKLVSNAAQRISFTLHASLRPQDTLKILAVFLRCADLRDATVINAVQALVGRTILFSKLDVSCDDIMSLVEVWRDANRAGHGALFPSGFRPWLRNQLAVRGEEVVNGHSVMTLLETMHTGQPHRRDALSLEMSGVLPASSDRPTLLRYLHYLSFYFTEDASEGTMGQSNEIASLRPTIGAFDWTSALSRGVQSGDLASLAVALGVCARIGRIDSAMAVLARWGIDEKTSIIVPKGSPREWSLWAGVLESMARLRLKSFCPHWMDLVVPEGVSSVTKALLLHACFALDIRVDPLGVLLEGFRWDVLSAEGMAQLLVALWQYLDLSVVALDEGEARGLYGLISTGLEVLVSRLEDLPEDVELPLSLPLLAAMIRMTVCCNFVARDAIRLPIRVMEVLSNVAECYSARGDSSSFWPRSSSGCRTEVYTVLNRVVSVDACLPFKESISATVRNRHRLRTRSKSRLILQKRVGCARPDGPGCSDELEEASSSVESFDRGKSDCQHAVTIARRVDSGLCGIPIDLLVYPDAVLEWWREAPFFVGGGVRFSRFPRELPQNEDVSEKLRDRFRSEAERVKVRHVDNEPCCGEETLQAVFVK